MAKKKEPITSGGHTNKQPGQTIILTTPKRGGLDLAVYMNAIRAFDAIERPRRVRLLDMYDDVEMDTHVESVMLKLKAAIFSTPIVFRRDGKIDEKIQEHINSPWFLDFLIDCFEDEWKGVGGSLFQFYRDGDWLSYKLIPRKHVDAINQTILRNQSDSTGLSWDNYADLLYIGHPRQIGRMAKLAFWVILKRNDVSDWANFAEIFGQPMREGTYDQWNDDARQKLIADITALGSAPVFIHPEGTNIRLLESSQKSGTADVYERLAKFSNAEISKGVLGNTLTTEAGEKGTQALGTVHQDGEQDVAFFIKRRLLNILNWEVTDIWADLGLDTRGGVFSFEPVRQKDPSKQIEIDCKLHNDIGLPMSHDYFYEVYGVPKPDNYEELLKQIEARKSIVQLPTPAPNPEPTPEPDDTDPPRKDGKTFKDRITGFFVRAPKKGALGW